MILQNYLTNFNETYTHYRGVFIELIYNFQTNLNFNKNVGILSFKGYRCFLWSYMYTEKLNELSNLLIFHENELLLVPKYMEF